MNLSILNEDRFATSHGAEENFLGLGALYYALTYITRAKLAVCIGSGSGFVPKCMRQAQRDLGLLDSRTVLIDANIREDETQGFADYHDEETAFRKNYPEVEIIKKLSSDAAHDFTYGTVDYLHIDGDHSYEGVSRDFYSYGGKMKQGSYITFHDSTDNSCGVKRFLAELEVLGLKIFTFPYGNGTSLLRVP